MVAASRLALGVAPSGGMTSELTGPGRRHFLERGHLLIGIIGHALNGALDLLQRAAR